MAKSRAAAGAGELLARVSSELKRGWPPGLTVLTGDDLYHLDKAQRALLDGLVQDDGSGFGLTVYGQDKVDVATVIGAARSAGMFAARRVVFVSDALMLEGDEQALQDYAAAPPPGSHLIVRAPALDQRRKLHKVLTGAGRCLEFSAAQSAGPGRILASVTALADERGLRIDRDAATLLAQLTGGDLYRVAREMDKLRAWLGDATRVSLAAVREVAAGSGLMSGWEVADALLKRDRPAALAAARRLVDGGDEPIRILGGLAWRARVMLQAKALLESGTRPDQVVRATRAWYFRDALLQGLRRYTLEELLGFPQRLLSADRQLKSRAIHPRAVIESLVDDLTGDSPVTGEMR